MSGCCARTLLCNAGEIKKTKKILSSVLLLQKKICRFLRQTSTFFLFSFVFLLVRLYQTIPCTMFILLLPTLLLLTPSAGQLMGATARRRLPVSACDGSTDVCACTSGKYVSTPSNLCVNCLAGFYSPSPDNTYVYMCGLKGMETGIKEALGGFAEANGVEWADFVKSMKKEGRYHVEVY